MATLREFIRDMTSLPVGSTIRDSIENPKTFEEGSGTVYCPSLDLEEDIINVMVLEEEIL